MAWTKKYNIGSFASIKQEPTLITNQNVMMPQEDNEFYEIEPGEVLDVILNDQHEYFKTYEDIGKAKIRLIYSARNQVQNTDEDSTVWAKPLDPNKKDFPLKHEVVLTAYYITRETSQDNNTTATLPTDIYYSKRLNSMTSPHHNAMLNVSLSKRPKNAKLELGEFFLINEDIRPLQQYEGDITYEGRNGQSIRFGHNENITAPNIKIRVGQQTDNIPEIGIAPIDEDLNKDASSIYMTVDEDISLEEGSDNHKAFVDYPDKYDGKQIIINSDRIILNSRTNELLEFAKNGIHCSTEKDFVVSADKNTIIDSSKIYLGNEATEHVVLGDELKGILEELIDAITSQTHPTPAGPSGPPINNNSFIAIKNKLRKILSKQNFTL